MQAKQGIDCWTQNRLTARIIASGPHVQTVQPAKREPKRSYTAPSASTAFPWNPCVPSSVAISHGGDES